MQAVACQNRNLTIYQLRMVAGLHYLDSKTIVLFQAQGVVRLNKNNRV